MSLGWKWFVEYQTENSAHMHGIRSVVFSRETEFQKIDVVDSVEYGRMLLLDGKVQSTVRDEHFYHEALVHPAMLSLPEPGDVLIIGGGEGGTLREVLRHPSVRRAVMVDIDAGVVEAARAHMPELSAGAFDDPRAELVIGDGRRYVEEAAGRGKGGSFDAIFMDVTDPLEGGPGALLYTKEFYAVASRALRAGGILVTQATSTYYSSYCFATLYRTVKSVFGVAGGYHTFVPAYDSPWGFVYGTKGPDPKDLGAGRIREEVARRGIRLRYYDERVHGAMFALPRELLEEMGGGSLVATDADPTFMPI